MGIGHVVPQIPPLFFLFSSPSSTFYCLLLRRGFHNERHLSVPFDTTACQLALHNANDGWKTLHDNLHMASNRLTAVRSKEAKDYRRLKKRWEKKRHKDTETQRPRINKECQKKKRRQWVLHRGGLNCTRTLFGGGTWFEMGNGRHDWRGCLQIWWTLWVWTGWGCECSARPSYSPVKRGMNRSSVTAIAFFSSSFLPF